MKPSLYLLIPALFLVSCDQQEVATYDECIMQTMQDVSSDVAAREIIEACRNRFPSESQEVVEAKGLVYRNKTYYEVNSNTPFTGVLLTYHQNGLVDERVTFKDGKRDGSREKYFMNGQLMVDSNYKNGKPDGFYESYWYDGRPWLKQNWKDGEADGIWETYNKGRLYTRENYKDDELDGISERYSLENGRLISRKYYKNDELDGIAEIYSEDGTGTLKYRQNYKDGELLGSCDEPGCTDFN